MNRGEERGRGRACTAMVRHLQDIRAKQIRCAKQRVLHTGTDVTGREDPRPRQLDGEHERAVVSTAGLELEWRPEDAHREIADSPQPGSGG